MKRIIVLMLFALTLTLLSAALADPFDPPSDDSFSAAIEGLESIEIQINGSPVTLTFDSSEEYSSVLNGLVQASFYAYSSDSEYLYELFLNFPDTVESGSSVTPEYALQNAPLSSVVLVISDRETEQYYYAGQSDGAIYPAGSSYAIDFDSVSDSGADRTYSGRLSASLVGMNADSSTPLASFSIENAPFSFTMPMENASSSSDYNPFDEMPQNPGETPEPSPTPHSETQEEAVRV